ncbi:M20/M25/M40 family metallo-hydrolase [Maribellus sp. CM-23]|uniref:M20/M25/M40 family metallo-hydrolase n=1 Tax=Maribellus sp. CM-23 TaxID=2781026 RepID=UPI001F48F8D3|nr:M20/M25/M40 family metallo-hydrolase [Maribellus sp. CM-23]MCE4564395.1 M20/M25/M40 family metallo-hydrolase [Maribellus sp. CM-23]
MKNVIIFDLPRKFSLFLILAIAFNFVQNNSCYAQENLNDKNTLLTGIFKELVEINTSTSDGNTTIASQAMEKTLIDAGFPKEDVHVLSLEPTKGNLVARYRGIGKNRPLLLLAHIDVVDAKKGEWSADPFKLTESDGFYYGRGTADDKAMAAIFITNLISYFREGYVPERDIVVCLTSDEENGGPNGLQWILKEHFDLLDAGFCINEGGSGQIINGEYKLNEIQVAEKIYQSYDLEVKTKGGHSSMPTKNNAIFELAEALSRLAKYEFPCELNESTRNYFEVMSNIEKGQVAVDMKAILNSPPDAEAISRLSKVPFYNALLRTTCVATLIEGGHAENALPQTAKATVNCRILPDTPIDDVYNTIKSVVANERIKITPVWDNISGESSPLSSEIMDKVTNVTNDMWPGVAVISTMSTGASDGLFLRNAGIPTYGVSGIFEDINENRAHGKDERIAINVLFEAQEFLYRLVKELSSGN